MNRYVKWALPLLVLGLMTYFGWGFASALSRKREAAERIHTLPACAVTPLSGQSVQLLATGRPLVLVYFDPDCDHCQREANELRQNAHQLAHADIWLLSAAPLLALNAFAQAHQLNTISNLHVAHITQQKAYDTFGFTSVPDLLIYHADGSLAKRFRGETSVTAIANYTAPLPE
ncbi:redoxin domain-containing protein [Spirosoma sp. 209]|uniref:redoxin domain-containing protein n=1 Tax=Spirosoma sp. 209 TaxID=1955701 RepID=UPI00098D0019|nr:redoxin domain-containing protein [Spirosoma sp. 209]